MPSKSWSWFLFFQSWSCWEIGILQFWSWWQKGLSHLESWSQWALPRGSDELGKTLQSGIACGVLHCIVVCSMSDMCSVSAMTSYISQPIMGWGRGTVRVGMDGDGCAWMWHLRRLRTLDGWMTLLRGIITDLITHFLSNINPDEDGGIKGDNHTQFPSPKPPNRGEVKGNTDTHTHRHTQTHTFPPRVRSGGKSRFELPHIWKTHKGETEESENTSAVVFILTDVIKRTNMLRKRQITHLRFMVTDNERVCQVCHVLMG